MSSASSEHPHLEAHGREQPECGGLSAGVLSLLARLEPYLDRHPGRPRTSLLRRARRSTLATRGRPSTSAVGSRREDLVDPRPPLRAAVSNSAGIDCRRIARRRGSPPGRMSEARPSRLAAAGRSPAASARRPAVREVRGRLRGRRVGNRRVAELAAIGGGLLEVVPEDLLVLPGRPPGRRSTHGEALVQLRARPLGEPGVGRVAHEDMREAEGILGRRTCSPRARSSPCARGRGSRRPTGVADRLGAADSRTAPDQNTCPPPRRAERSRARRRRAGRAARRAAHGSSVASRDLAHARGLPAPHRAARRGPRRSACARAPGRTAGCPRRLRGRSRAARREVVRRRAARASSSSAPRRRVAAAASVLRVCTRTRQPPAGVRAARDAPSRRATTGRRASIRGTRRGRAAFPPPNARRHDEHEGLRRATASQELRTAQNVSSSDAPGPGNPSGGAEPTRISAAFSSPARRARACARRPRPSRSSASPAACRTASAIGQKVMPSP